jgi:hypothetical protein
MTIRYGATKKLQRLRFIRRQLVDRGYRELKPSNYEKGRKPANNDVEGDSRLNANASGSPQKADIQSRNEDFNVYLELECRRDEYTREVLGYITDEDVENMFLKALQMGPEQTAVYSIELAKVSAKVPVCVFFLTVAARWLNAVSPGFFALLSPWSVRRTDIVQQPRTTFENGRIRH